MKRLVLFYLLVSGLCSMKQSNNLMKFGSPAYGSEIFYGTLRQFDSLIEQDSIVLKEDTLSGSDTIDLPIPIFLSNDQIKENQPVGTYIGTLSTPLEFCCHSFSLVNGNGGDDNDLFYIDSSSLFSASSFDFESKSKYSIRVRLFSLNDSASIYESIFHIKVVDIPEDSIPYDSTEIYLTDNTVLENQPIGTYVGTVIFDSTKYDRWTLEGDSMGSDNSSFYMLGSNLYTSEVFDYEQKSKYNIKLMSHPISSDSGFVIAGFLVEELQIHVIDIPEDSIPYDSTEIYLTNNTVLENQPIGTYVGTVIFDSTKYDRWTLEGDSMGSDNSSFYMLGSNLYTSEVFDYEQKSKYNIKLMSHPISSDSGFVIAGFLVEELQIHVIDIPEDSIPYDSTEIYLTNNTVLENQPIGTYVGTVIFDSTKYDRWTLEGDSMGSDNSSFYMLGSNLYTSEMFDYEQKSKYNIKLMSHPISSDSGFVITGFLVEELQIHVIDIPEDSIPYDSTEIYLTNNTVLENQPIGTYVGTLVFDSIKFKSWGLDPDSADTDNGLFYINGNQLRTRSSFDFENKSEYKIRLAGTFWRRDSVITPAFPVESFIIQVIDVEEDSSSDNELSISVVPGSPSVGDIVTVRLHLNELTEEDNISSFEGRIIFDDSVFQFLSAHTDSIVPPGGLLEVNDSSSRGISFSYATTDTIIGNGSFFYVKLRAISSGMSHIYARDVYINNRALPDIKKQVYVERTDLTPFVNLKPYVPIIPDTIILTGNTTFTINAFATAYFTPRDELSIRIPDTTTAHYWIRRSDSSFAHLDDFMVPVAEGSVEYAILDSTSLDFVPPITIDSRFDEGSYFLQLMLDPFNSITEIDESDNVTYRHFYIKRQLKAGDVDDNGKIQAYDASLVLKNSVGIDPLPDIDPIPWTLSRFKAADVDLSGRINANDASLILKYSAELIRTFPSETSASRTEKNGDNTLLNIQVVNNELVFKATGEVFGLNVDLEMNEQVEFEAPQVIGNQFLSAVNISTNRYSIGLASIEEFDKQREFLRIPFRSKEQTTIRLFLTVNAEQSVQEVGTINLISGFDNAMSTLSIYPNPVSQTLHFDLKGMTGAKLFDLSGQLQKEVAGSKRMDVGLLKRGIYMLELHDANGAYRRKIVIE